MSSANTPPKGYTGYLVAGMSHTKKGAKLPYGPIYLQNPENRALKIPPCLESGPFSH